MNKLKAKISIVFFILLALSSCLKPVQYPDEPNVEFVQFDIQGDSGIITFFFTDGDGDIGLNPNQIDPPYDPGSFYHYNVYLEYYEVMGGQLVKGTMDPNGENAAFQQNNNQPYDTIPNGFRIEDITPFGQNKSLKGNMQLVLSPFYNFNSNHNDSIRFSILLIDRNLNHSNVVYTPVIKR